MAAPRPAPQPPKRPKFAATPLSEQDRPSCLEQLPSTTQSWIPCLCAPAPFSLDNFFIAMSNMSIHPEYQSSTILRADILIDHELEEHAQASAEDALAIVALKGYSPVRRIRRRLLPKRPMDGPMEQECLFYASTTSTSDADSDARDGVVLLLPDFAQLERENKGILPYYHPQVFALAFRYLNQPLGDAPAQIRLDVVSLASSPLPSPLPPDHRIYRTSLILLQSLSAVGCGIDDGYQKRVNHDLLAGREEVQDLYAQLKVKYKADLTAVHDPRLTFSFMLRDWKEVTDPVKHVFEDVAIVAWLIIVWRHLYPDTGGKPPGGFVDVGCGNGLLVYLLACEGYEGYGVDLRARKSWEAYNPPPRLVTTSLDPPTLLSSSESPFPPGSFLIGNHADELTPWMPLFAACTPSSSFLSIPCCAHDLSSRFTRQSYALPQAFLDALPTEDTSTPIDPSPTTKHPLLQPFYAPSPTIASGRSFAYQLYLAQLTLECGFVPEREALRIPSTKNYGFLGRRRVWDGQSEEEKVEGQRKVRERVAELVEAARRDWKARTPEGKAGEGH